MKTYYDPSSELLTVLFCGSVDDGKSTLLGHLLYDIGAVYEDQVESIRETSLKQGGSSIDYSLFTDGLATEREQKITIDVAYRYFSTPRRRYIIADVPGHEQYTRNMITAASGANCALILADARKGLLTQSKRHLLINSLMGIPHIVVLVNKMDLVDYDEGVFRKIKDEFVSYAAKMNIHDLQFIPVSALVGDMVVDRGNAMPWYQGTTLFGYLEDLEISSDRNLIDFRLPIQYVARPHQDFRGYGGSIASGEIHVGEEIVVLPSMKQSKITSIVHSAEDVASSFTPQAVMVTLADDIDMGRGDIIARKNNLPIQTSNFEAMLCWMSSNTLTAGKRYIIKHLHSSLPCELREIYYRLDIEDLHRDSESVLRLNEIGKVALKTNAVMHFDTYSRNRNTGHFILIDEMTNDTVGAGIFLQTIDEPNNRERTDVGSTQGHEGCVVWFTGLSGSGKSSIAEGVRSMLAARRIACEVLDGDFMRQNFGNDLGYSREDRDKNINRAIFIAQLLSKHGVIVLATFISPYEAHRALARGSIKNFIEVFVNAPLEICEQRDVKGLYKRARGGEIPFFTGISDEYEAPQKPEIELRTDKLSIIQSAKKVFEYIIEKSIY